MIFADLISSQPNDIPVVVGAIVTLVGGFFAISKIMLNQASKDREADRQERLKLTLAIEHMASNSTKVAEATERSANEAKERNGHLAELVLQGNKLVDKDVQINQGIRASLEKSAIIAAEDRDSLTHPVTTQVIKKQMVETQVVNAQE